MFVALLVIGLITAFVTVPIDTRTMPADPHPLADYASAVSEYNAGIERDRAGVMADGGSLIYVHGTSTPRAIVLIHGLTNSPRQFRELAQQLYDRGDNVIVPRLPLHGLVAADVGALREVTAERYRAYADSAVDVARGLGDTVLVVGLSAGGNVAAWIAQHRGDVARVVVIAPAITLARIPRLLAAPAMNVMERAPNLTLHQTPDTLRAHAYFGVSTRGLGETLRLGAMVLEDADREPPVVRDITLVINDNDRTISEGSALTLMARWKARAGITTRLHRFDRALRLPHDVIDVSQRCGVPAIVYPVIIALIEGQTPAAQGVVAAPCADSLAAPR
ncbi:MAG TPA: alpha/beta fold hydrolase [Gemmatimonadaceae bacterium]|nr:alpha/beta fold hydrolase [Gemmatimonadaceae bacterium]